MYKKTKMASSGFIPPTPMSSNTYSTAGITQRYPVPGTTPVTMVTHGPHVGFARPTRYCMMPQGEGLGTVVTGMGPAGGDTHPAFLQQQYVPKFPVEKASERIIPIQGKTLPDGIAAIDSPQGGNFIKNVRSVTERMDSARPKESTGAVKVPSSSSKAQGYYKDQEKEDLKVQNRKLSDENSELRKKVEQEQNKIKELNEANRSHLQDISNFEKNYSEVYDDLQKEKKTVQDLLDTRIKQLQHIVSLENDVKKYQQDIDDRDRTIMSLGKDWESLCKEHNDLKSRSTVSPATGELSDPNRPTKLAEMFLELYNNEWRDCYTTVTEYYESQTSVIQMLLRTCLKIYSHCQMIASEDLNALKRIFTLFGGDSDDNLLSQMKQRRRRNYQVDIDLRRVKTGTEEKMEDIFGPDLIKHKNVQAFWIKCLDICWRMVILNPPVIMDTEINKKGQPFDNAKFNPYTQSGHVIEFIVWPALYTHQGGVILSKGIAQGFQTTDSVGGKRRK